MLVGDFETTGLLVPDTAALFAQPHITEIYIAKVDPTNFQINEEFETLINPEVPIDPFITKLTGIDNEMVKDSPTFAEVYDDLCSFFLGENDFVAHNVTFERDCLKHELRRLGFEFQFPWTKNLICTIEESFIIENKRLKLGVLYEKATGEKMPDAHRAKPDVLNLITCMKFLREEGLI
jgi:DNA polymerase-3 subunit epsilon